MLLVHQVLIVEDLNCFLKARFAVWEDHLSATEFKKLEALPFCLIVRCGKHFLR
jgi:hypothetical protein